MRRRSHALVDFGEAGGRQYDCLAAHVLRCKAAANPPHFSARGEVGNLVPDLRRHHRDDGPRLEQQAQFARGNLPTTDQEAAASVQIQKGGEMVHSGALSSLRCAGPRSPSPWRFSDW